MVGGAQVLSVHVMAGSCGEQVSRGIQFLRRFGGKSVKKVEDLRNRSVGRVGHGVPKQRAGREEGKKEVGGFNRRDPILRGGGEVWVGLGVTRIRASQKLPVTRKGRGEQTDQAGKKGGVSPFPVWLRH